MRILIVNTSEYTGGAAIAANRLTEALRTSDIDASMLVMDKESHHEHVIAVGNKWQRKRNFLWERCVIWVHNLFSRKNLFKVSVANTGFDITRHPAFKEADLIHLQWVNQGMLSLDGIQRILRSGKPVVWTMHDMWECTSICHYAYRCERFKTSCHHCPFLRFPGRNDLSAKTFRKKKKIFESSNLHIVTVSSWLKEQVEQSSLLGDKAITVIPNTLPVEKFTLYDQTESRALSGLPSGKRIILFGAARVDDPIKGLPLLLESIDCLLKSGRMNKDDMHVVLFGGIKDRRWLSRIPVSHTYMGLVKGNDILSRLYSAADVTVSASYYETFGQTLIESLACGCIPVSFGNSGQRDIITHKQNGYLADYLSPQSLADGIVWALEQGGQDKRESMRRQIIRKYSAQVVASAYSELYRTLIVS